MSIGDEREGLRSRIRLQKQRIRDLETALQEAQLNLSTRPHSLLRLVPENSSNVHPLTAPEGKVDRCTDGVDGLVNIDSSLPISGKTFEIGQRSSDELSFAGLPASVISLGNSFPLGTPICISPEIVTQLLHYIPPEELSERLTDMYFNSATTFHSPIAEPVFRTRILKYVFDSLRNPSSDSICLYKLSVFYLIMSIGSYVEGREGIQTLSTRNIGSNSYYQLARASFSVQGLSRATNTWTVASILLMKYFSYIASDILSSDQQDFSTLLSQTIYRIGMHKDPSHWKLDEQDSQDRRIFFWEACLHEYSLAIICGQPMTIDIQFSDCKFAKDTEPNITENGGKETGFRVFVHQVVAFFLSRTARIILMKNSNYAELLELDRNFRNFTCPAALCCPVDFSLDDKEQRSMFFKNWSSDPRVAFQQFYASIYLRELALLHAHRKYVVQAIKLDHHDPLKTKYGPSITNAIRSARILLCALESLAEKHTKHTSQISFFWASAFSALFILGSLALVGPMCASSAEARESFEIGVDMFREHRDKEDSYYIALSKLRDNIRDPTPESNDSSKGRSASSYNTIIHMLEGRYGTAYGYTPNCYPSNGLGSM